nr:hypothetical protein [uncultured Ruegeria sp.]
MKRGIIVIMAMMMAGAVSAESVAELHEGELNAIDGNNDGFLSRDEFNAFSDYAFQAMDEDKNGTLGQAEAKPFLSLDMFRKVDRNNDSQVSRAEYDAQMNEDFLAADQDGNGQLD